MISFLPFPVFSFFLFLFYFSTPLPDFFCGPNSHKLFAHESLIHRLILWGWTDRPRHFQWIAIHPTLTCSWIALLILCSLPLTIACFCFYGTSVLFRNLPLGYYTESTRLFSINCLTRTSLLLFAPREYGLRQRFLSFL